MTKIPFIKFSLCLLLALSSYAQTSKTYTESFNVNEDVVVSLKAHNAEIIVETWNKDRVDVEATITVETEDEKLANKILENFKFEALGNSSKVEITAIPKMRAHGVMNDVHFFPNGKVEILTEDIKGLKIPPPPPPIPPFAEMDFDFDMEQFNEEGKAYIIKFQDEIKDVVNDSNFKKQMKEWRIKIEKEMKEGGMQDSVKVMTYRLRNNMKPKLKKIKRKLNRIRASNKVKKKIIIKMPKDAKLDLNVRRSELKIAELNLIDANLNFSSLHIDELTGNDCKITANHSNLDILKAQSLDLDLKYAKEVKIGNVSELISVSKTSNLALENLGQKAIIEGTFGELNIKNISDNFTLIDINLKNSSAQLNIPHDNINFYINSKSSKFNQKTNVDFKMNTISDAVIYQNSKPTSNAQNINIKADFSSLTLM